MRNLLAFWVWKSNAVQVHSIKLYLHSFATVSTKIFVVDVWILPSFLQFYRSWSFFFSLNQIVQGLTASHQ